MLKLYFHFQAFSYLRVEFNFDFCMFFKRQYLKTTFHSTPTKKGIYKRSRFGEHVLYISCSIHSYIVIKTFSIREGWWYIGIKGDGGVKSKGTRLVIEKE